MSRAYQWLGYALVWAGRPEEAITNLEQAMREHPDFPWLVAGDRIGVQHFLRERGWIEDHESVERSCCR